MATDREWANAYRAQAAADLEAARLLQGSAPSVLAMLLQMVLEKLAKAALLRSGAMTFKNAARSHVAASRMILVLKRNQQALLLRQDGERELVPDLAEVRFLVTGLTPDAIGNRHLAPVRCDCRSRRINSFFAACSRRSSSASSSARARDDERNVLILRYSASAAAKMWSRAGWLR